MEISKEEKRLLIINVISIIGLLLIVISGGYIIYYKIVYQINSCTSMPMQYAVENVAQVENLTFERGAVFLYTNKFDRHPYMIVPFNITNKLD